MLTTSQGCGASAGSSDPWRGYDDLEGEARTGGCPRDAQRLAQLVRQALREELSVVRAELLELRLALSEAHCRPPRLGAMAPLPGEMGSGRGVDAGAVVVHPPPSCDLPGMVSDGPLGGGDAARAPSRRRQLHTSPAALPPPRGCRPLATPSEASDGSNASPRPGGAAPPAPVSDALNLAVMRNRAESVKLRVSRHMATRPPQLIAEGESARTAENSAMVLMQRFGGIGRSSGRQLEDVVTRPSISSHDDSEVSSLRRNVSNIVKSTPFEVAVCLALVTNAIFIGVQANQSAAQEVTPDAFGAFDVIFCLVFTVELVLRMYVFGWRFFKFGEWWNYFDMVVVAVQIVEEIAIASIGQQGSSRLPNMSGMRVLRILRLLRILRVLRVIRFISELKKMVYLIMGSLQSFFWAMVLLSLLIYVLAVFFTQLVADSYTPLEEGTVLAKHWDTLSRRFGTTMTSALMLYMAVSGGIDWEQVSTPVNEYISPIVGAIFVMYSLFAVLVLLNLVTGVFVDGAMRLSRQDKEIELFEKAFNLLKDGEMGITWQEFKGSLSSPEMSQFFEALEISTSRAGDLFHIIDTNQDGRLSLEELVAGGLMLQGPAKAIDVAALSKYLQGAVDLLREDLQALRRRAEGM